MAEVDIYEFAKMFDAALASDNPSVQKALRNLMMLAAVVHAEEDDKRMAGPLETVLDKVNDLERMVRELQNSRRESNEYRKYSEDYYYGRSNPWISSNTSYHTPSSIDKEYIYKMLKDKTSR